PFFILTQSSLFFFFSTHTAPTDIYPLSLHDALPIFRHHADLFGRYAEAPQVKRLVLGHRNHPMSPFQREARNEAVKEPFGPCGPDRKSTRLNSSHQIISYAVFCLKKKKITHTASPKE